MLITTFIASVALLGGGALAEEKDPEKSHSEEFDFTVANEKEENSFYTAVRSSVTEYPYLAQVTKNGLRFMCFGTLLSELDVLITASCLKWFRNENNEFIINTISVSLGSLSYPAGIREIKVAKVTTHPDYSPSTSKDWSSYDLAVLRLETPVVLSQQVQPIEIAKDVPKFDREIQREQECLTFVWNNRQDPYKERNMSIVPVSLKLNKFENCRKTYPEMRNETDFCGRYISSESFSCRRNMGSPLVCQGKLYGLHVRTRKCKEVPEIFVRVDTQYGFIKMALEEKFANSMHTIKIPTTMRSGHDIFYLPLVVHNKLSCNGILLSRRLVLIPSLCVLPDKDGNYTLDKILVIVDKVGYAFEQKKYTVNMVYVNPLQKHFAALILTEDVEIYEFGTLDLLAKEIDTPAPIVIVVWEPKDKYLMSNDTLPELSHKIEIEISWGPGCSPNSSNLCFAFDEPDLVCVMTGAPIFVKFLSIYAIYLGPSRCNYGKFVLDNFRSIYLHPYVESKISTGLKDIVDLFSLSLYETLLSEESESSEDRHDESSELEDRDSNSSTSSDGQEDNSTSADGQEDDASTDPHTHTVKKTPQLLNDLKPQTSDASNIFLNINNQINLHFPSESRNSIKFNESSTQHDLHVKF